MEKIDGRAIAQNIIENLKKQEVPKKIFAAVQVGENAVSENFLRQKENLAKELGVDFRVHRFPDTITNDELRKEVGKISTLKKVGGVIVQLPLPSMRMTYGESAHMNSKSLGREPYYVLNAIVREKDVDVLGERALGAFYNDRNIVLSPAVSTLQDVLHVSRLALHDSKVAVVGLGFLIGKPISVWLMKRCKELYLLDKESDLKILKEADLVIVGVGAPGLIKPEMLKDGAGVIDFGCSVVDGKIRGDFNCDMSHVACDKGQGGFYTPTPGGTGPILVAKILENFYELCK